MVKNAIATLTTQNSNLVTLQTRNQTNGRSHGRSRSQSRSHSESSNSICYYHNRFDERATKCNRRVLLNQQETDWGGGVYLAYRSRRVLVTDSHSGKRFLIDSGADKSFLPPSTGQIPTSDIALIAANGRCIRIYVRTYGPKSLHLDLGHPMSFVWTFEIADVTKGIIGAYFLHYYGLLVDVRRNRLVDSN